MNISNTLKLLREEKELLQKELASYLSLSIGSISNYEKGVHFPSLETLDKLATYYGVTSDFLLGRTKCRDGI